MKRILLAVDGSKHSIRATEEALKIATLMNDTLIEVVLVADFDKAKKDVLHSYGKEDVEIARRKAIAAVEQRIKEKNVSYRINILHGPPGATIVNHSNKNTFDLLVIGSRGLNKIQEMVLGSVSYEVVKKANCPVLVVK